MYSRSQERSERKGSDTKHREKEDGQWGRGGKAEVKYAAPGRKEYSIEPTVASWKSLGKLYV